VASLELDIPNKALPLLDNARYKVLYGGRGSTKSWTVARLLLIGGVSKPLRILCTREIQRTISESVHQLLRDQIAALGLEQFYSVTDTSIKGLNGTQFFFGGLRQLDVAKIKSFEGIDIVWCEEAHVITKKSWEVLIPTIRKPGSEIWVTFNPELDTDETYQRFVVDPPEDSIVIKLNYSDNPWFPDVLEKERLALAKRDPEAYDNVWEGNCRATVEGAIFAKEVAKAIEEKRIRPVPYDPLLKVHTIWDLGWNDKTSIIMAQRAGSQLLVIDYIEDSHRTYAEYCADLDKRDYRYGTDFVPHDARHKDPKQGKSTIDVLEALGRKVQVVPDIGLESGIQEARLAFPRVYFDETRAAPLIEHLKRYRRQVNQTTGEAGGPLHDEHSHASDAYRYMCVIADEMTNDDAHIPDPYSNLRGHGWAA